MDQNHRQDRVGDLSRDMQEDSYLPRKKTKNSLLSYLVIERSVEDYVIEAFNQAWKEYKQYRKII
jgi:hypothetical protein